jgi:nucleotide-binding universal stress UspA family protein
MARLFRRILVPHDFSDYATGALKVAAELAAPVRGRLIVLHVLTPFYSGPGFPTQSEIAWLPSVELVRNLRERLEALVARALPRTRLRIECRVEVGNPLSRILQAARDVDSIVMATLGRTGLSHLMLGSVAEKVVRHAPVPLLTVRTRAVRRSTRRTRRTARARKRAAGV